ncbi:STAS domain-containing protein [Actinoplanes sp. N902-109]|uniref:STAS domain-containing protein n=1 Tax=Actinoplanes sp. (strain N902-109) TaxID=649831 RepID=UPI0003295A49|nr:STAS domain-containing protein [Actinoplanes sp. N902-109]AGL16425.1 putative anti-sigma factor [Actinoplanes sp. N902-109]
MTVVPGSNGTALLICDCCRCESTADVAVTDAELVWPLIAGSGWTGSPFATGSHRCQECRDHEPRPPAPTPRGARTQGASYTVQVRPDVDAALVTPLTDLDAELSDLLRDDLMSAAARHRHVVADLHAVDVVDSAGLGLLVRARQEARRHAATFDLAGPSRFVRTVLHTMRLDGVFRTFPDTAAALRALTAGNATTAPVIPGRAGSQS